MPPQRNDNEVGDVIVDYFTSKRVITKRKGGEMKRGLLVFTVLFLIFLGLRRNSAPFFSVAEYRFIQTGLLSDDYFSSIKTHASQLFDDNYSAHAIIASLKKEFSVLNKVAIAYRPCGVYVMTYAHKPVCCINDALVCTVNNELFSKNTFTVDALADVSRITVAQDHTSKISSFVSSLLSELPPYFNENYDLEVINEHCMHFIDKKEQRFTVVSSVTQKRISYLLAQCESVKKNIIERKGFDKGVKWVADIRFADYIVAYKV